MPFTLLPIMHPNDPFLTRNYAILRIKPLKPHVVKTCYGCSDLAIYKCVVMTTDRLLNWRVCQSCCPAVQN